MQRVLCQTPQVGGVLYRIAVRVCGSTFSVAWEAALGLTILDMMKGESKEHPSVQLEFPSQCEACSGGDVPAFAFHLPILPVDHG